MCRRHMFINEVQIKVRLFWLEIRKLRVEQPVDEFRLMTTARDHRSDFTSQSLQTGKIHNGESTLTERKWASRMDQVWILRVCDGGNVGLRYEELLLSIWEALQSRTPLQGYRKSKESTTTGMNSTATRRPCMCLKTSPTEKSIAAEMHVVSKVCTVGNISQHVGEGFKSLICHDLDVMPFNNRYDPCWILNFRFN